MYTPLTQAELDTLTEARVVLTRLKGRRLSDHTAGTADPLYEGFRFGRLLEAAESAEYALFNLLNTASSHLSDAGADAAIDTFNARRRELPA